MKICPKCGLDKYEDRDFYRRKDGHYHSWCKSCLLQVQRDRWKARKLAATMLFGGACDVCGYDKNLACLDFHHLDPAQKEYVFHEVVKRPWDEVLAELKKCVLLCKNCHGEVHNPEMAKEKIDIGCANRNLDKDKIPAGQRCLMATGTCPVCKNDVFGTKYCSIKCSHMVQRRVERPSREQLEKDINELSWVAIGRKYGVSDNAIKKWAKSYQLIERN